MEIELQIGKKLLDKIERKTPELKEQLTFKKTNKSSVTEAVDNYNYILISSSFIKPDFLPCTSLNTINDRKFSVNSFKCSFENLLPIRRNLFIERMKTELHSLNIAFRNSIVYSNSLLKSLFLYNCKNILFTSLKKLICC